MVLISYVHLRKHCADFYNEIKCEPATISVIKNTLTIIIEPIIEPAIEPAIQHLHFI